ncbi:MAG: cold shock domain-containing protein [Bacilli bacterium]|nr:cold shock domain-containing protein [Bacilli bacterium]
MKGKVVRFNPKKGFGFIRSDDKRDIFFHYSSLVMDGFKTVDVDADVEFDLEESEKGLRALNIKVYK